MLAITTGVEPADPTAIQLGAPGPAVHPTAEREVTPAGIETDAHGAAALPLSNTAPLVPEPTVQHRSAPHETDAREVTPLGRARGLQVCAPSDVPTSTPPLVPFPTATHCLALEQESAARLVTSAGSGCSSQLLPPSVVVPANAEGDPVAAPTPTQSLAEEQETAEIVAEVANEALLTRAT
jgi:hypothetical protein